jgi:TonB dependent receptor-like, beta-barrel
MRSWGLFAQDDFRVTPRLTLNLGLRYDVTYPIQDTHDRLANFDPSRGFVQKGFGLSELYKTNYDNFSPRIGVAWDVFGTQKTVLRAGFGMIYVEPTIRTFMFSSGGLQLNPTALIEPGANGNISTFLQSGASTDFVRDHWTPEGPIFPNDPAENVCDEESPCNFFGVDRNLKTPYVMNWNVNVQQALGRDTVLQVAYVANRVCTCIATST